MTLTQGVSLGTTGDLSMAVSLGGDIKTEKQEQVYQQAIIEGLVSSASVKNTLGSAQDIGVRGEQAISKLWDTYQSGGMIYVAGDKLSRLSIEHLAEELQCRYRAGDKYGRQDRPAVPSQHLTEIPSETLDRYVGDWLGPKDSLVVFAAAGKEDKNLAAAIAAARKNGAKIVTICSEADIALLAADNEAFVIPSDKAGELFSTQRCFLHAICEGFEPEFVWNRNETFPDALLGAAAIEHAAASDERFVLSLATAKAEMVLRLNNGGAVYICGNGGSACDSMELTRALREQSVSGRVVRAHHFLDPGYLTCCVNDNHSPFHRGVQGIPGNNNVLVVYSTSGQSQNIIDAVILAKEKGIYTIVFGGKGGGKLAPLADAAIIVPSDETGRIQEAHAISAMLLAELN